MITFFLDKDRRVSLIFAVLVLILLTAVTPAYAQTPEGDYGKAERLFRQNNYAAAIESFEEFIIEYPTHTLLVYALYYLGWAYFHQEQYPLAAGAFLKIVEKFPDWEFADEAQYNVANGYLRTERLSEAYTAYLDLLSKYPNSKLVPSALYDMGWLHYKKKEFELAETMLKRLLEKGPEAGLYAEGLYLLATVYADKGKAEEAARTFSLVSKTGKIGLSNLAFFRAGELFFERKEYRQAINFYRMIASKEELLDKTKQRIAALEEKRQAMLAEGGNLSAMVRLLKEENRAKLLYEKIAREPDYATSGWYRTGESYFAQERFYEARIIYEEYLRRFPKGEEKKNAEHAVILTFISQKKLEPIEEKYNSFVEQYSYDSIADDIRFLVGNLYYETGKYAQALEQYKKGLEEYPVGFYTEDTFFQFASTYMALNEYDRTIEKLKEYVEKYSSKGKYFLLSQIQIAYCYLAKGDAQEALFRLQTLEKKYPQSKETDRIFYFMGLCYFDLEKYNQTILELNRLLRGFPKSQFVSDALFYIGNALFNMAEFEEAIESYQQLISRYPDSLLAPQSYLRIGRAYYALENPEKAIQTYQTVVNTYLDTDEAGEAAYQIGWTYMDLKQHAEAIEHLNRAVEEFKNKEVGSRAQLTIADIYIERDEKEAAISAYARLLELDNRDYLESGLEKIGTLYLEENKKEEAVKRYEKMLLEYKDNKELFFRIKVALGEFYSATEEYQKGMDIVEELSSLFGVTETANDPEETNDIEETKDIEEIKDSEDTKEPSPTERFYRLAGRLYLALNKPDRANETYIKAIDLYPRGEFADELYFGLGKSYLATEDWHKAEELFARVIKDYEWSEYNGDAQVGLGFCLIEQRRFDDAISYLKKTVRKFATEETAAEGLYRMGNAYSGKGDRKLAHACYQRVRLLYSVYKEWTARAMLALGEIYEKEGGDEEAGKLYKELITDYPEHDAANEAKRRLGRM